MVVIPSAHPPANNNDLRRLQSLVPVITGTLKTGINQVGMWVAVVGQVMGAANAEVTITHNLGRVPNGYIVFRTKVGGVVYDPTDGNSRWTNTTMILRDTVASDVVSLLVI